MSIEKASHRRRRRRQTSADSVSTTVTRLGRWTNEAEYNELQVGGHSRWPSTERLLRRRRRRRHNVFGPLWPSMRDRGDTRGRGDTRDGCRDTDCVVCAKCHFRYGRRSALIGR